jgi:ribosomal 50S subunit-recycling heat shock protein
VEVVFLKEWLAVVRILKRRSVGPQPVFRPPANIEQTE